LARRARSQDRLRICLVTRDEPGATGTSRYADRLAKGLRDREFYVDELVTRPSGVVARVLQLAGTPLHLDAITFLSAYPPALRWPSADLYHLTAHTFTSALPLSRRRGPLVTTVHDIGRTMDPRPGGLRHRVHRAADRFAVGQLRRTTSLIAVSEWTKRELIDRLSVDAERVAVTYLGVDLAMYRPQQVPPAFMTRYGLRDDQRYVIYVGSDEPRKNLSNVWRALSAVRGRFPGVVLLKVGRGYDPAARDDLRRLAAQLGMREAIRYFDDVPENDLPLFYAASELLVMPSLYEGFGLPALEAMASGLPVVVSDRAALPELVGRESGILVDPSDAAGLARAIIKLLDDRALAMRLGEQGRARARRFTWEAMVSKTIDVYRRAIDSDQRRWLTRA